MVCLVCLVHLVALVIPVCLVFPVGSWSDRQDRPNRPDEPDRPFLPSRQSPSARELLFDVGQVLRGRAHPYRETLGIIGFGQDPHLGADLGHDRLSRKRNM